MKSLYFQQSEHSGSPIRSFNAETGLKTIFFLKKGKRKVNRLIIIINIIMVLAFFIWLQFFTRYGSFYPIFDFFQLRLALEWNLTQNLPLGLDLTITFNPRVIVKRRPKSMDKI